MTETTLRIGRGPEGLALPLDLVARKLAIIGMSGAGKTVTATVIAEEMCRAGLPWVVFDPVGVWWGLRVGLTPQQPGFPVLIIGGPHADVPLEKGAARDLADALAAEDVCAVIDTSRESKTLWRAFVADFADRAMELTALTPRSIILEEAPELVPQRPVGREQQRSAAEVERLVRLGRNNGYGVILLTQRFATVAKDVLTQCDNIIAMRSIGKPDRKAVRDWIGECVTPEPDDPTVAQFIDGLPKLPDGHGWFWSPQWLKKFEPVHIRERITFHPGATRDARVAAKQVTLASVESIAERFRRELTRRRSVAVAAKPKRHQAAVLDDALVRGLAEKQDREVLAMVPDATNEELDAAMLRQAELEEKLANALDNLRIVRADYQELSTQVKASAAVLRPLANALAALFADGSATSSAPMMPVLRRDVYAGWRDKLPAAAAKLLDALIEQNGRATRAQLMLLGHMRRSHFNNMISTLNRAGLIERDGDSYVLRAV